MQSATEKKKGPTAAVHKQASGRAKKKTKTASDFAVSGMFLEKDDYKKFTKIVSAYNPANAAEKVLSLMGSKHAVKRRHVKIDSVKEAK